MPTTDRVAVARIAAAKGLHGVMKIEILTDVPARLAVGAELTVEGEATPRRVTTIEGGDRPRAIGLAGVESREAAEALIGRYLESDASPLPAGTWYWHEIVGLAVIDERGTPVGRVAEVFRAGGAEVYRIERHGADDLFVPALRRFVHSVDPAAGQIVLGADALEEPE